MKFLYLVTVFFGSCFAQGATLNYHRDNYSEPCDAYINRARILNCEQQNYLVTFGHHYCVEFEKVMRNFTRRGKHTITAIRDCLINKMQEDEKFACANAKERAAEHHVQCYVGEGYCELGFFDKLAIYNVIYREFKDPLFKRTSERISEICQSKQ